MTIPVKPLHFDYHSCEEDILATIATFLHKDFQLMYCNSWGGSYKRDCETIGASLSEGKSCFFTNLKDYHGIDLKESKIRSLDDIGDLFSAEEKKGRPILLYIDEYDCPWSPFFHKASKPHPLLLIEKAVHIYRCLDPYLSLEHKSLNIEKEIDISRARLLRIELCKPQNCPGMISKIRNSAVDMYEKSLPQMKEFIWDLISLETLEDEIKVVDGRIVSQLLDKITYLARRRQQYAVFLNYINVSENLGSEIAGDFVSLALQWEIIGRKIMKMYCMNLWSEAEKGGLLDRLKLCIEIENSLSMRLLNSIE